MNIPLNIKKRCKAQMNCFTTGAGETSNLDLPEISFIRFLMSTSKFPQDPIFLFAKKPYYYGFPTLEIDLPWKTKILNHGC